jgi:hypothetical protein
MSVLDQFAATVNDKVATIGLGQIGSPPLK